MTPFDILRITDALGAESPPSLYVLKLTAYYGDGPIPAVLTSSLVEMANQFLLFSATLGRTHRAKIDEITVERFTDIMDRHSLLLRKHPEIHLENDILKRVRALDKSVGDRDHLQAVTSQAVDTIIEVFPGHLNDQRNWEMCEKLVLHIDAISENILGMSWMYDRTAQILIKAATFFAALGKYMEAADRYSSAAAFAILNEGHDSPRVVLCHASQANMLSLAGHHERARELIDTSVDAIESSFRPDDSRIAVVRHIQSLILARAK